MLLKEIINTGEFARLINEINSYSQPIALFGLSRTARAAFLSAIQQVTGRHVLVLTKDERSASRLLDDTGFFTTGAQVFSPRDLTLRPLESFSREYEYRRIRTLGNLVGGSAKIVISPVDAALMYTMPRDRFLQNTLTIKDSDVVKRDDLVQNLVNAGYIRREMVEGPGQFSVRGDIVDLYTPDMASPVRIEFWGDEIDRINTFDTETQRRMEQIKKVHISPVKEVLFTDCELALQAIHDFRKTLTPRQRTQFDTASEKDIVTLENGIMPRSMDKYISVCYSERATLFDYLENPIVFLDDWSSVKESYSATMWQHNKDIEQLLTEGIISKGMEEYYAPDSYLVNKCKKYPTVIAEDFVRTTADFSLSQMVSISCHALNGWNGEYKVLSEDITSLVNQKYKIMVLAGTKKSAQTLAGDLQDMGFNAYFTEKDSLLQPGTVAVTYGRTHQGFDLPMQKIRLITGHKQNVATAKPKKKNKDAITSIDQISKGDYVVHQNYGIGIYDGIHNVSMQG
ncbi:MAG: transcription-repair coupling factor, partial [Oscillospiraceae bacterium]|nr:transcription-repair coupling factor [Oscillospiraceae bacterium]